MFERRIQVEAGDRLALTEMAQNVVLVAWDQADVQIRSRDGQEENFRIERAEAGPTVSARAACEVRVPASLPVTVRQVAGNLKVKGLAELEAEQVRGNLTLDEVDEALIAEVYGNLKANATTSLRLVGTIYGSASLDTVRVVALQNVRGNLTAKASDRLRASRISGNLRAQDVGGSLDVDQVGGNAQIQGVSGSLTMDQVAGNLTARNLTAGARVPRIGGNLVLDGDLGTSTTYHFKADGNATLRLSEGVGAHVTLRAGGKLLSSVALTAEERADQRDGKTLTGTLGDGGAEIVVEADGNVVLGGVQPAVGAGVGEEISRQVEESLRAIDLEAISRQVSDEMEAAMSRLRVKLESVDWDRIGLQAQQGVERAMERMQRDMDRMVEKAAHHQERLERKAQKEARRQERLQRKEKRAMSRQRELEAGAEAQNWRSGEAESVLPGLGAVEGSVAEGTLEPELDLEEERLSILKMVEQGQITPEEAEMLLDALR